MPDNGMQPQFSLADLDLLAEVSQLLTVIDLDQVLERVVSLTARSVGASNASLFLHHQHSDDWERLLITRPLGPHESARVVQSVLDTGLAGWVMRERSSAIVADTKTDPRWHVFEDDTTSVRSALCVPLIQDGEVLALITLVHPEPNHFNDYHLRLLNIVTNQATVAIRNAQLFNQMQAQQRQLEATLHAIPDLLIVVDDAGQILVANDAAADFIGGVTQQELVGKSLASILHVDSALSRLGELRDNLPQGSATWAFEARSDRKRKDCVVNVSRWENLSGGTAGHVIVMHDVTTMRDLDRFKSEMLKMASHDLRSPLALIVGYADLIRFDTEPDSSQAEYLDVITRSTRRMSLLLDDLLKVEEIRTSPEELQKPTNFSGLVLGVLDNLAMQAGQKNQHVETDIRLDGMPPITIDPALVREAMENLTANASKYTPEGGTIQVQSYYDDYRVHFTVIDNGVGVAAYDLQRIFEWGFRSKHQGDENVEGKGLGLSMVKTVLERHGGEVCVESEEGVGSRFGFWLPR
jgi:PAS domain S-box-containing protein